MAEIARDAGGTVIIAIGIVLFAFGVGISATGIGAICGIPIALFSLIPLIWGLLMRQKANRNRQEAYLQKSVEEVARIHAASQDMSICITCRTPNPRGSTVCSGCHNRIMTS